MRVVRFGIFDVDLGTRELQKNGLKVKLQDQPFEVLAMLLERPGELVTREELQNRLWPADTFVDFDQGLGTAIRKLREALGDSAENPRFIETLPRRGFRFLGPVAAVSPPAATGMETSPPKNVGMVLARSPRQDGRPVGAQQTGRRRKWWLVVATGGVVLAIVLILTVAGPRDRLLRTVGAIHEMPVRIESVAVLPLENLSRDPEQEYFADGMTDELITNLGKISALRVISRQSTMRYKGSKKPLPEIARELNVDALVEGTVLRSGDRVRITANLLHAPNERHLWAEAYERDLRDVLALQGEVARAIAGGIRATVTPHEENLLLGARKVNPAAYDDYLRAGYHREKLTTQGMAKSFEYLQRAVAEDPGYAPAHAAIADVLLMRGYGFAPVPARQAFSEARQAASKAVELDDSLAGAHDALAAVMEHDCDFFGADRELKRALELNPSDANAHEKFGLYLTVVKGHHEEALSELRRSLELDPLAPGRTFLVAVPYNRSRQYDRAIPWIQKALELDPNYAMAHHNLGLAYIRQGKYKEGLPEVQKAIELGFDHPIALSVLATAYAKSGQRAKALKIIAEFEEQRKHGLLRAGLIAMAELDLGNKERALAWLEKAWEEDGCLAGLNTDPDWYPLRSDPRFQALVRRMSFPQ